MKSSSLYPLERLALAETVYEKITGAAESLRVSHIGSDLAYLLGAIVTPNCRWDWTSSCPEFRELMIRTFPTRGRVHPVWRFVSNRKKGTK